MLETILILLSGFARFALLYFADPPLPNGTIVCEPGAGHGKAPETRGPSPPKRPDNGRLAESEGRKSWKRFVP